MALFYESIVETLEILGDPEIVTALRESLEGLSVGRSSVDGALAAHRRVDQPLSLDDDRLPLHSAGSGIRAVPIRMPRRWHDRTAPVIRSGLAVGNYPANTPCAPLGSRGSVHARAR